MRFIGLELIRCLYEQEIPIEGNQACLLKIILNEIKKEL